MIDMVLSVVFIYVCSLPYSISQFTAFLVSTWTNILSKFRLFTESSNCLGWERTLSLNVFQPCCHRQEHLPRVQVAQSPKSPWPSALPNGKDNRGGFISSETSKIPSELEMTGEERSELRLLTASDLKGRRTL